MSGPKILPWLAAQHGVSLWRAEELHAESVRCATQQCDIVGDSTFFETAKRKLIALLLENSRRTKVLKIVRQHLKDHGFSGLRRDGCSCSVDSLQQHCGAFGNSCMPVKRPEAPRPRDQGSAHQSA